MTDENRKRNVADALQRADQALRAAEALLGASLHADAVSRAYYAAFHYLRAILYSRGVEARTHAGAIHVFNREFVQTRRMSTAHNRLLAGLQRSRELADYDPAVGFSADDARGQIADARTFGRDALALLRSEGWAPDA
jgi:uncharacterized protein (UPF0332 family)